MDFTNYKSEEFFDEFFNATGEVRSLVKPLVDRINSLSKDELKTRQEAANAMFMTLGITFGVYGEQKAQEKIFPFDIIPRVISSSEWLHIEKGLQQRITALNLFIQDVYNDEKIFKDGVVPRELVMSAKSYLPVMKGFTPPNKVWIPITGIDLVRDADGTIYVLEDNLRCPSGISYVLANRSIVKKSFPNALKTMRVSAVDDYCLQLYSTLNALRPNRDCPNSIALLTPGVYNSAYYEHAFLAKQMGIDLAEGSDFKVIDDIVMMRKTHGFERVDVIYRRVDDDYLDPRVFREDSMLGIPGLMASYLKGNVALANAPGAGIADDKAVYAYVPQMIKYYLDEEPILPNVPTHICDEPKSRDYVINNLDKMVVKATNLAGGYGMLMGHQASQKERDEFKQAILANPRNYIAQPRLNLSRVPTIVEQTIEGRHVDFRPYILYGDDLYVLPGGLTRVALVKDSLVVNSSQGGGSKDTWVLKS